MKKVILATLMVGLMAATVFSAMSVSAAPKPYVSTSSDIVSSQGTICVVLTGRMLGMPGAKVRCRAIDGVNTFDCTKEVYNSGTTIPYYYVCHYPPYPGRYKLSVKPVRPGFHGESKEVDLSSPAVVTIKLHIGIGKGHIAASDPIASTTSTTTTTTATSQSATSTPTTTTTTTTSTTTRESSQSSGQRSMSPLFLRLSVGQFPKAFPIMRTLLGL